MAACPFCSENAAESNDHVIPRFLGGKRTIKACRNCNSKFGHTFEAVAAKQLEPIYILLAKWGVPIPPRTFVWQNAFEVDGATLHLSVGPDGVTGHAPKPIFVEDQNGVVTEAYFTDPRRQTEFTAAERKRNPDADWRPAEKKVSTNLDGLRLSLQLGYAGQQLALKMAIAAATQLPGITPDQLRGAGATLHHPSDLPPFFLPTVIWEAQVMTCPEKLFRLG